MNPDGFTDALNFSGTLFLPFYHWLWMLVALGLGVWVGWRTAGEGAETPSGPGEE